MRLHTTNASEYIGCVLLSEGQMFNYYPLRVLQISGKCFYVDKNNVMIEVPEEKDISNSVYFDEVIR